MNRFVSKCIELLDDINLEKSVVEPGWKTSGLKEKSIMKKFVFFSFFYRIG
ncbi:MAG: hypothetical protein JSV88_26985 [Candidatus Aminicenantes bacterium]|nr:MAG: hypothetical protein JSV88_26985 [Candidatus Aminicenantes bacterium]